MDIGCHGQKRKLIGFSRLFTGGVARMTCLVRKSEVCKYLQQISVRIAKEQGAMSKALIRRRGEQVDALTDKFVGASVNFGNGNPECQLK